MQLWYMFHTNMFLIRSAYRKKKKSIGCVYVSVRACVVYFVDTGQRKRVCFHRRASPWRWCCTRLLLSPTREQWISMCAYARSQLPICALGPSLVHPFCRSWTVLAQCVARFSQHCQSVSDQGQVLDSFADLYFAIRLLCPLPRHIHVFILRTLSHSSSQFFLVCSSRFPLRSSFPPLPFSPSPFSQ
jgi:hypothetical protein